MGPPAQRGVSKRTRSKPPKWSYVVVCGFILLAVSMMPSCVVPTRGGRWWLSPYTLKFYSQTEFTLSNGNLPVYLTSVEETDCLLTEFLVREGYVSRVRAVDDRREWMRHWNAAWRGGKGSLHHIFSDRCAPEMIEWTKKNSRFARFYWAEGFARLRSRRPEDVIIGRGILEYGRRYRTIPELRDWIASLEQEYGLPGPNSSHPNAKP